MRPPSIPSSQRTRVRPASLEVGARNLALLAAAGMIATVWGTLPAGCASSAPRRAPESSVDRAARPTWFAELDQLVERQARRHDRRAAAAEPPTGVPDDLAIPISGDARVRAMTLLSEALETLRTKTPAPVDPIAASEVSDEDSLEATRLYVSGRSRRLNNDHAGAERDLRQSARLNPAPSSVWREYGETQLALGNQPLAHSAFRRALDREPTDIRSLEALSKAAMERRDYEAGASLLARLLALSPAEHDPALPAIVSARLGRALIELGYLRAGAEALTEALDLPQQFEHTTNYISELTQVYRQRGDLWREIGDGAMRLGEYERAADAYKQASIFPSLDPGATTARRVFAAMRLGQSAAAARLILLEVAEAGGRIDDRRLELLRSIAHDSTISREMSRAITGLADTLSASDRRSAAGPLARAAAAVLPAVDGRTILRDRLLAAPADDATLRDLLAQFDGDSPREALEEVIGLVKASPLHESRYALALTATGRSTASLIDAWGEVSPSLSQSISGRLLYARLLSLSGDLDGAQRELSGLVADEPSNPAAVIALTSVLNRLGRYEEAEKLLASLDESTDPGLRLAKVLAVEAMGDLETALEILTPLLPPQSSTADADMLMIAARLSVLTGRAEDAEAWLKQVIEIDATRDAAYAALLALYGPSGPLANERVLIETVRAMRDANPQSPTLRLLRAQESAARRLYDVADRELRALVEEYPDRVDAIRTLAQVWRASGGSASGEQWLRQQIAERPGHTLLTLVLAEVLVSAKREVEAIKLLEEAFARTPGDDEIARALEATLRMVPGESKRADALTEARLARAPSSPDTFLELVEMALRRNDVKRALEWSSRVTELGRPLTLPQKTKSEQLAQVVTDLGTRGGIDGAQALELHTSLISRIDQPRGETLLGRIRLLMLTNAGIDDLKEAADIAAMAFPAERDGIYFAIANELWNPGVAQTGRKARPRDAVAILEHACTQIEPPPANLLAEWIVRMNPGFRMNMEDMADSARLASVRKAAQRAHASGVGRDLVIDFAARLSRGDVRTQPADAAQFLSSLMDQADDPDLAEAFLRLAIAFDENHVWANNNLGYRLLNDGRDIDDAHAMIERAYDAMKQDPAVEDRSSVTDSLGWARYKIGIIHDEAANADHPAREGAVTLLKRALNLAQQERDRMMRLGQLERLRPELDAALAIIADHTGDALWVGGDREDAIAMWTKATARAEQTLANHDPEDVTNLVVMREIQQALESARAKIEAAKEDRTPSVASMFRPVNEPLAPLITTDEVPGMID